MGNLVNIQYLIETDGVEHETKVHPGDGRVGDEGEPDELPERDVLGYGVAGGVGDPSDERRDREVESGQRRGCIRPKEETKKRRKNQIPRRRHQEQTRTCGSRSAERGKGRRRSARRREGYRRRRRSRRRTWAACLPWWCRRSWRRSSPTPRRRTPPAASSPPPSRPSSSSWRRRGSLPPPTTTTTWLRPWAEEGQGRARLGSGPAVYHPGLGASRGRSRRVIKDGRRCRLGKARKGGGGSAGRGFELVLCAHADAVWEAEASTARAEDGEKTAICGKNGRGGGLREGEIRGERRRAGEGRRGGGRVAASGDGDRAGSGRGRVLCVRACWPLFPCSFPSFCAFCRAGLWMDFAEFSPRGQFNSKRPRGPPATGSAAGWG